MTIIEVDGVNHQPLTVDSIQIFGNYLILSRDPFSNSQYQSRPALLLRADRQQACLQLLDPRATNARQL
jgi:hypothetical protein